MTTSPLERGRPIVFVGPSLPLDDARAILDADYRKPISRGDLDALAENPPTAVGIIDGDFYQRLAVSPKEVLRALRANIRIYGASSMGALRAAELSAFGMVGVGRIYEMYRDGVIDADDEVAISYTRDEYRQTSIALVNVRLALQVLVERGILTIDEAEYLLEQTRTTYFPDRSFNTVLRAAAEILPDERCAVVAAGLASAPDFKRLDAADMLRRMRAEPARSES